MHNITVKMYPRDAEILLIGRRWFVSLLLH